MTRRGIGVAVREETFVARVSTLLDRCLRRESRRALSTGLVLALAIAVLVSVPIPAQAEVNTADTTVRGEQTWYVYTAAGERPHVALTKAATSGTGASSVITVRAPDNSVVQTCTVTTASANGTSCAYLPATTTQDGVWSVSLSLSTGSTGTALGPVLFNWDIGVYDVGATSNKPGRVWTERYVLRDAGASAPVGLNLVLYYQTRHGFTYRIARNGIAGVDSAFTANAFGVVDTATCAAAHRSTPVIGVRTYNQTNAPAFTYPYAAISETSCSFSPYKIFFDAPSAALPSSVTLPGGTTTWLAPVPPVVSDFLVTDFVFTPTAPGARAGTIAFAIPNLEGGVEVQIDTNNDGIFDGTVDRSIPVAIVNGVPASVSFDGLDGGGQPIAPTTPLAIRVKIDRIGEVHFIDNDVELMRNGMVVDRLNGPANDRTLLWWDDSQLWSAQNLKGRSKCSTTSPLTSDPAGTDSTGGVHGWTMGTCTTANYNAAAAGVSGSLGTWGNVADIDSWTYVTVGRQFTYEVPGLELGKVSVPVSGTQRLAGDTVGYDIEANVVRYAHLEPSDDPANPASTDFWTPATSWSGQFADELADVEDNATVDWDSVAIAPAGTGTVIEDEASPRITWSATSVPIATTTVNLTYSVLVDTPVAFAGDRDLRNVAYLYTTTTPPGEPATCTPGACASTEHPLSVASLTLEKAVIGAASATTWSLLAESDSIGAAAGPAGASGSAGATGVPVTPDEPYALSESGGPATYVQVGEWVCVDDDTAASVPVAASAVEVAADQRVTCTVTNGTGSLTVLKEVVDGPAASADWNVTATPDSLPGLTPVQRPGAAFAEGGNPASTFDVRPGHAYTLSEAAADPDAPSTYRQVRLEIRNGDGTWSAVPSATITAPDAGETAVYRFVNEMIPPIGLPLTGGTSTDAVMLGGAGLLLSALIGAVVVRWRHNARYARTLRARKELSSPGNPT